MKLEIVITGPDGSEKSPRTVIPVHEYFMKVIDGFYLNTKRITIPEARDYVGDVTGFRIFIDDKLVYSKDLEFPKEIVKGDTMAFLPGDFPLELTEDQERQVKEDLIASGIKKDERINNFLHTGLIYGEDILLTPNGLKKLQRMYFD